MTHITSDREFNEKWPEEMPEGFWEVDRTGSMAGWIDWRHGKYSFTQFDDGQLCGPYLEGHRFCDPMDVETAGSKDEELRVFKAEAQAVVEKHQAEQAAEESEETPAPVERPWNETNEYVLVRDHGEGGEPRKLATCHDGDSVDDFLNHLADHQDAADAKYGKIVNSLAAQLEEANQRLDAADERYLGFCADLSGQMEHLERSKKESQGVVAGLLGRLEALEKDAGERLGAFRSMRAQLDRLPGGILHTELGVSKLEATTSKMERVEPSRNPCQLEPPRNPRQLSYAERLERMVVAHVQNPALWTQDEPVFCFVRDATDYLKQIDAHLSQSADARGEGETATGGLAGGREEKAFWVPDPSCSRRYTNGGHVLDFNMGSLRFAGEDWSVCCDYLTLENAQVRVEQYEQGRAHKAAQAKPESGSVITTVNAADFDGEVPDGIEYIEIASEAQPEDAGEFWVEDPDENRFTHGRFAYNPCTSQVEEYESQGSCLETRNYIRAFRAFTKVRAAEVVFQIEAGAPPEPVWDSGREAQPEDEGESDE